MQYEEIVALLPDYLEDKLSARQMQGITEALKDSEELRKTLTCLEELMLSKNQWAEEEVPNWHHTAFAARVQNKPVNWMNWFSMATSIAAVCLVVFRVQIVSNNDGYQISFGDQINKVAFRRQVNTYLDDFQSEQAAFLDHQFLEFENKQLKQNQEVLTAALEFNRDERHQDLKQLTSYFLQQRSTDLVKTQTQYRHLFDSQIEDRKAITTLYASIDQ